MKTGWFKTPRGLLDSPLWLGETFSKGQALVDLLGLARFDAGVVTVRGISVGLERGQLATSEKQLADRWRWSRGKVRRFLDELETGQQIVHQKNNVTSVVTMVCSGLPAEGDTANRTANRTAKFPNGTAKNRKAVQQNYSSDAAITGGSVKAAEKQDSKISDNGHAPKKGKEWKRKPPPPTPSDGAGGGGGNFDKEKIWQQLETRLLNNGVRLATKLVGELRARATEPATVAAIIDHFEQKKPRWGSGALYSRLQAQRSGIDPLLLWPEPDQSLQRRDEATRKQAEMQHENEAGAARRQQDQADRARLEQAQGAALDALDKGALRQLIADHFPEDLIDLYQKRLGRSEKPQGTLRVELLSVLAQLSEESAA